MPARGYRGFRRNRRYVRRRSLAARRRRRYIARRRRRYRRSRAATSMLPTTFTGARPRMVRLNYQDHIQMSVSNTTIATAHRYYANNLNKPDFDSPSGGHQPYGHDELAIFWQKYKVVGARMTCTFSKIGDSASDAPVYGLIHLNDSTDLKDAVGPDSNIRVLMERPGFKNYKLIPQLYASPRGVTVSKGYSDRAMWKNRVSSEDTIGEFNAVRGTSAAYPASLAYFHIIIGTPVLSAITQTVQVKVDITYMCQLIDAKSFPQT